jgi:hypothetical protein
MAIFDAEMQFSNAQRVCNAGAAEESENVYDFGVASPNVAKGEPITLLFTVDEVFAGTATTLTITAQSSSDNAVSDGYANITGITTGAIAKATLAAGYNFVMVLPPFAVYERWLRIMYTGDNTFETTGRISCRQVINYQTNKAPGA